MKQSKVGADRNSAPQTEAEQGWLGGKFSSAVEEEEVEETVRPSRRQNGRPADKQPGHTGRE